MKIKFLNLVFLQLALLLSACQHARILPDSPSPTIENRPTLTASPVTPLARLTLTITPTQTFNPDPPALVSTPSPAPSGGLDPMHPLYPATLAGLRERETATGEIQLMEKLVETQAYTRYKFSYPSDNLVVTGVATIPVGEDPLPVIILNHGYQDRSAYWSGWGTDAAAEHLARRGFLALAPDFRGWGGSAAGPSLFHTGLVRDVLNLLDLLPTLPQANPLQVGLWGHSMGGGISTKALAVDPRIQAAVLYAPNSADDSDLISRWGAGCLPGIPDPDLVFCNPAEVVPEELAEAYAAAAADPEFLRQVAPIFELARITAPVQIHIGLLDGQHPASTPPEWSEKLYAAMLEAGVPVEIFRYSNQGHFFQEDSWEIFMQRVTEFFTSELQCDDGTQPAAGIKNPGGCPPGFSSSWLVELLDERNCAGLWAFCASFDVEFDFLALFQIAEAIAHDRGIVDENVLPTLALNKAVAFTAVKPFDRTDDSFRHFSCLLWQEKNCVQVLGLFHRNGQKKSLMGLPMSCCCRFQRKLTGNLHKE